MVKQSQEDTQLDRQIRPLQPSQDYPTLISLREG